MTSAETANFSTDATNAPASESSSQKPVASKPQQSHPMGIAGTANPATPAKRTLDPMEISWQFVQEYYTVLNKNPNRLHCFYNKNSTMLHGVETETVKQCQGQQVYYYYEMIVISHKNQNYV
jgi:hypothetical protein